MIKKFCFIILLLAGSVFSFAQKIRMEVMMGDKKIGEINAEKKINGKAVQYEMSSHVEATMMVTVKVSNITKSYWYNGMLTNSRATRESNMPGQDQVTTVELKGTKYAVTINKKETPEAYPIKLCVTCLYYQEPVKDTLVYSEMQGMYIPVKDLGNHQYQLSQPKGKKDIYSYANGKLTKIETIIAGKNVVFVVR